MKEEVLSYKESFDKIVFGTPLLTSPEDEQKAIEAVNSEFSDLKDPEALVLMGHGTTHQVNVVYAGLDKKFKTSGHSNVFIGTVEAEPTIQDLVREVSAFQPSKIYMTPFMIVAGDHAHNDMAGDSPDSWVCQFKEAGFEVCPVLKGLGEYPGIRAMFVEHAREAIASM